MLVFTIEFDGAVDLKTKEIWPDGDAPAHPTVEDAIERIKEEGSALDLISAWNLECDLGVSVNGKPVLTD